MLINANSNPYKKNRIDLIEYNYQYQLNVINNNKLCYKTFIVFLCIVNVFLLSFIIAFEYHLSRYSVLNQSTTNELKNVSESNDAKFKKVNHMLINVFNKYKSMNFISTIFQSKEEYDLIINWLPFKTKPGVYFCYQASTMKDNHYYYKDHCLVYRSFIIIKAENNRRFGVYIGKRKHSFTYDKEVEDDGAFLFSLDNKEKYEIKDPKKAYTIHEEGYFTIGTNDLVIKPNCLYSPVCSSSFPNNYGHSNNTYNDLTGLQESFKIVEMEVYSLLLF